MDALPLAAALGLIVGLILALTGAGGGILAVPLLVFGTGMSVARAGPIGLLAVGMAAALGAVLGFRTGQVRYRAALLIAATGMLLSPAGLWAARHVDGRWLGLLFAMTLLYVASKTWRQAAGTAAQGPDKLVCARGNLSGRFVWTRPCMRVLGLSGALAGFLSGLLGVGAGFDSVYAKLFTLPDETLMWPGHDYKGQAVSTMGWEKRHNARLANRNRADFVQLMGELNLPKPKLIDVAVPANQNLGLPHSA